MSFILFIEKSIIKKKKFIRTFENYFRHSYTYIK
jgi:hypothetical protein